MTTRGPDNLAVDELTEAWAALSDEERVQGFVMLPREQAEEFLSHLTARDALELLSVLPEHEQKQWLRGLPPDDVTDIVQELPEDEQADILALLDERGRRETQELLEYDEDDAGGLMTPRFARLRADMTVSRAIEYLRHQKSQNAEMIYYAYVVDAAERLVGVVSFRELVISPPDQRVSELMTTDVVKIPDEMDQEEVSRIFAHEDLLCLPVVDERDRIVGIITADDIVDVVEEEATEDMHKIGGSEALDAPYLQVTTREMLQKRAGWLLVLLLLGFFTVQAMSQFENQLAEMVVLGLFVPLIISCGGNTGSQAATIIVRAMALDEVRLRDWFRVMRRELLMGLGLGLLLGVTGMGAALLWNLFARRLGVDPFPTAIAIACSILCVVMWGTIAGSMLPFLLRRSGADPASASAPLVATIVDASGLVIYFSVATLVLRGMAA
jgi:magnesium transporter